MARRGRKTNWDRKVAELIADLRKALVAREQDRIEATVAAQMSALVGGLAGGDSTPAPVAQASSAPAASTAGRGNRKPRSAASLAKQAAAMRRSWARRRAAKSKAAPKRAKAKRAAKASPGRASPGGSGQGAALKAYWAGKRAAKATAEAAEAPAAT